MTPTSVSNPQTMKSETAKSTLPNVRTNSAYSNRTEPNATVIPEAFDFALGEASPRSGGVEGPAPLERQNDPDRDLVKRIHRQRQESHRQGIAVGRGESARDEEREDRVTAVLFERARADDAETRQADQHDRGLEDDRKERQQNHDETER